MAILPWLPLRLAPIGLGMLERETILKATEKVLRRYGPQKASVVDVARMLGVSHGTVYRHFPSKNALREAVTRRWIERTHEGMSDLADDRELSAPDRLRHWIKTVFETKRGAALADPELFDTYCSLVSDQSEVVEEHVRDLLGQLETIITSGVAEGTLSAQNIQAAALAIFDATARFHHPAHARGWSSPATQEQLERVCDILIKGLGTK